MSTVGSITYPINSITYAISSTHKGPQMTTWESIGPATSSLLARPCAIRSNQTDQTGPEQTRTDSTQSKRMVKLAAVHVPIHRPELLTLLTIPLSLVYSSLCTELIPLSLSVPLTHRSDVE